LTRSSAPAGRALMGSTSIILGEVIAPTSPAEAPTPASTAHGGLSTLESAAGGEIALLSTAPCGGEAVRASSAKASPTTIGSVDLVREGKSEHTGTLAAPSPAYIANTSSRQVFTNGKYKNDWAFKSLPRSNRDSKLRPKQPRPNHCMHLYLGRGSSPLCLQTMMEGILRRLLH
jgi:hypothetical protein